MAKTTSRTLRIHLRLAGWVADDWTERFEGIEVRHPHETWTVLFGKVKDQSALFGILRTVEARGMTLLGAVVRNAAVLTLVLLPLAAPAATPPFDGRLPHAQSESTTRRVIGPAQ